MKLSDLRAGDRIVASFPFLRNGATISHYFTLEKREPDWLSEDGWWAVEGQAVTTHKDGSTRTGREIDAPVSYLALDKFEVGA